MIRKILVGIGLLIVVAGIAVGMFMRGSFGLDDWIVRQVVAIQSAYIVPTMDFESFDYQAPRTVVLDGLTLTAPDGTRVVDCERLTLTLAEIPRRGRPLVIERVDLASPTLRLIRDTETELVSFKGLVPFVKGENITNQEQVSEEVRLSSVLEIRRLSMTDGGFFYDIGDGSPPMQINGLEFAMDVEPREDDQEPGWYDIDTTLDEEELFHLDVDGRFNLDTLNAHIDELTMKTDLDEDSYSVLPPEVQSFLREHDARGTITVSASGFANVRDMNASDLELEVLVEDFNVAMGEYRLPVDRLTLEAQLASGLVTLETFETILLNGRFDITQGWLDLATEARHAQLDWTATDLDLQVLLRTKTTEGEPPKMAGILSSAGHFEMDLARGRESITGNGEVHIVDGRLVNSPTLKALANAMSIVGHFRKNSEMTDTADLVANITPLGLEFSKIEAASTALLARGRGTITWEQQMNLSLNAGPLEKIQSKLGPVGKILGAITDQLVTYRVTGPLGAPQVKVKPLGL